MCGVLRGIAILASIPALFKLTCLFACGGLAGKGQEGEAFVALDWILLVLTPLAGIAGLIIGWFRPRLGAIICLLAAPLLLISVPVENGPRPMRYGLILGLPGMCYLAFSLLAWKRGSTDSWGTDPSRS